MTANSARGISDVDAGFVNPANVFTNRLGRITGKQSGVGKILKSIGWIDTNTS